jgi:hypothetical protein
MSQLEAYERMERFKGERINVVEDAPSGRPSTAKVKEQIDKRIRHNCRITVGKAVQK